MVRAGPGRSRRAASGESLKSLGHRIIQSALEEKKVEVAAKVLEQLARMEAQDSGPVERRSARDETAPAPEVVIYSSSPISEEEWRQKYGPSD